jgi:hypothetical protein
MSASVHPIHDEPSIADPGIHAGRQGERYGLAATATAAH